MEPVEAEGKGLEEHSQGMSKKPRNPSYITEINRVLTYTHAFPHFNVTRNRSRTRGGIEIV